MRTLLTLGVAAIAVTVHAQGAELEVGDKAPNFKAVRPATSAEDMIAKLTELKVSSR
jgi:hypothetical protein